MYFLIMKKRILLMLGFAMVISCVLTGLGLHTVVQTSAGAQQAVSVPALMYHSIRKDPAAAGKYVVSPQTLEADLLYLKENGYTTVLSSDLSAYVREGKALPEKPIVITFDDGHVNNLTYALPILEKLDMRAVICIVGSYSEANSVIDDHNPGYAYLSWDEIRKLEASGRIEIANHSYAMHQQQPRKGASKMWGESKADYEKTLSNDLMRTQELLKKNCTTVPIAFSYPFGSVCDDSLDVVRNLGFLVSYGCAEKVNYISDETSLYCLGRFNRPSGIPTAKFMKRIQN